ncbi:restriction endonuclease subunit S [Ottowia massiliensis]|jgi:restriction modification system, type I|uniref:restriction endonuclease subunit S n=1 Tax=Ottowia massiliensis TaxID=2045302 RepID=UPI000C81734B|nr:restriction endonuclease subunit S [Ottowia massiliensis]
MIERDLKPGWRRVKFGDVVRQCKEKADPDTSGLERYIAGDHMDTDDLRLRRWGEIGSGYLGPAFHMRFKPGQVLYGSRRTYLRKVAVADFEGICANTTFVLEPKNPNELLPEFLPFLMQTEAFNAFSVKNSKGSVNPYINFSDLARFEFALPPMEEQQRVVRLLMSAEVARTAAEDAATHAEKLRKSLLLETFDALQGSDMVRIPFLATEVSCRWVKARDAGAILMGRQLSPKYKTGKNTKKYLRVANVFDGFIDTSDVNEMDFNESEFETFKLQSGDVLLNEGQSRELVGRSAIFRDEVPDCCFQNTLIRFRPNGDVLSEFAHYYFQYCQYTSRFVQISKQTTSIAHLGVQRFAEMKFPLVATDVQRAVVDALSAVVTAIPQLKKRAQAASAIRNQVLTEGASR